MIRSYGPGGVDALPHRPRGPELELMEALPQSLLQNVSSIKTYTKAERSKREVCVCVLLCLLM